MAKKYPQTREALEMMQRFKNRSFRPLPSRVSSNRGFTAIELLVVLGILGILAMTAYPSIMNSLAVRKLENDAKQIMTTFQKAKFQAVKTKNDHRVRFFQENGGEFYVIEQETSAGIWTQMVGFVQKGISSEFQVTNNLPESADSDGKEVIFTSLGFSSMSINPNQNTIVLQSDLLARYNQPDVRVVSVYRGGAIHYEKRESE